MTYVQAFALAASDYPEAVPIFLCTLLAFPILYRLFIHPLSHVPGPLPARITSFYLYAVCYLGIECRLLAHYHRKYKTSVLRIAPNAVSISDGAALHQIYVAEGGFSKDSRYENFKVGGHDTIFSARDTAYRDLRAKAVLPLFATGRVRAAGEDGGIIRNCVRKFIERFESEKVGAVRRTPNAAKIDVLDLAYRLMMDSTTGYLFNKTYNALDEQPVSAHASGPPKAASHPNKMSAVPFIFAIVDAGRFSLLPTWLFHALNFTFGWLFPDSEFLESLACVHDFAAALADDVDPEKGDTYQSRLLAAGISRSEMIAQCMAVMFAGTDSTAVKLVTIIFHLVQNPRVHDRLREEISVLGKDPATDPQTLPYLRAVIREGLRLGMANPARFSRTVPPGGFEIGEIYLPAGTDVGLAPYVLHHNPELFLEPFAFRPERWLDEGKGTLTRSERQRREMERDLVPFSAGLRACIARNFAIHVLFVATRAIVESGLLGGARTCTKTIELEEYFNTAIKGHKLLIEWSR